MTAEMTDNEPNPVQKRKPGPKPKPRTEPAPEPNPENKSRKIALAIRGTDEWRNWVQDVANHCRLDLTKLVDLALIDYAKAHGVKEPAPKR